MKVISGINGFCLFYFMGKHNNINLLKMVGINAILYHIFNPNNQIIRYYDIIFNLITIISVIVCYNIPFISYILTLLAITNYLKHRKKRIIIFNHNFYTQQIIHSYMVQLPLFLAMCHILKK